MYVYMMVYLTYLPTTYLCTEYTHLIKSNVCVCESKHLVKGVSTLACWNVSMNAYEFMCPSTYFSVEGPSAWNDLPFQLQSLLVVHYSKFYISLTSFFVRDWAGSASE